MIEMNEPGRCQRNREHVNLITEGSVVRGTHCRAEQHVNDQLAQFRIKGLLNFSGFGAGVDDRAESDPVLHRDDI